MPEPPIGSVPTVDVGPGTGTIGLSPAPPISVEPSGIPTRPTVDAGGRDEAASVVPAQLLDEVPDSPPPSNNAPVDAALADAAQPIALGAGLIGEMPGVVISVDPSGMPTGRVDCGLSGDVASMPAGGCIPGIVVCAMVAVETSQSVLVTSIAAIGEFRFCMRNPPADGIDLRKLRPERYFQNARPALRSHDGVDASPSAPTRLALFQDSPRV
ncbi:hypothetical protein [Bradyrhizobium sp. BR 10289]|uniref:hypothetical protein n=1 Tax=Bradyrhizobium sp. BR 10289 TaxID=2749993 RepID=UPI001E5DEF4D|nr:hypothetical protein [Bradyrhizobium sp. BR 10289]